ncbi:hypothetical protein SAMN05216251_106198 [Actinacidiphila alni]|uniref:VOC domain-containing protein n=1 Tax=Actinacidiphila alni TaxID=380248 RepID=A0A1I2EGM2_9ACTN|nr:VOC family protein [Actinacidiphila alni]SFE91889.1 hypothetical protein SAMN05216251_106198 [Actinacidiphila alni]
MTDVPSRRPPGTPCWVSLMAHRADRARDFYGALFGWEYVPGPEQLGAYVLAELDGRPVAGIGEGPPAPHRPVSWTTMLATDDVDRAAELVRECGGTVGVGPLQVGPEGRLALAVDPSGAVFGIWEAGTFGGAEAAGALALSELVTRGAAVVGFYEAVFGLEAVADGSGRFLLRAGGRSVAVVRDVGARLPRERGAHWTTPFAVRDVSLTTARALTLGAHTLGSAADSPSSVTLADPEGAAFTLVSLT